MRDKRTPTDVCGEAKFLVQCFMVSSMIWKISFVGHKLADKVVLDR